MGELLVFSSIGTGFDVGCEAVRAYRGPVTSLINGNAITANDERYALAA